MPALVARPLQDITYMATAAGSRRRSRAETFPAEEEGEGRAGLRASKRRKDENGVGGTKTAAAAAGGKKTGGKRVTRSSVGGDVKKPEPGKKSLEGDSRGYGTNGMGGVVAKVEEADDDFVFSRKVKRQSLGRAAKSSSSSAKTPAKSKSKALEPIEETPPPPPRPAPKSRKKKTDPKPVEISDEDQDMEVQVVIASKSKGKAKKGETERARKERAARKAESAQDLEMQMDSAGLTAVRTPSPVRSKGRRTSSGNVSDASTTVAVLSSETPVIRRNQKFREKAGGGQRRSSMGMRGRRASSLMDNGVIAEPHDEISHEDFFKHIEAEMIEPRRLRQLYVWCGKRALSMMPEPKKSKTERVAHQRARIIQEEILKLLIDRQDLTNWFSMVEPERPPAPKKPNPRNVDNAKRLEEGLRDLKRLREERESWEGLLSKKPPPTEPTLAQSNGTTNPTTTIQPTVLPSALSISPMPSPPVELPESQAISPPPSLDIPNPSGVLFNLDSLADSLHKFNEYRLSAEMFAGKVVGEVADRLEEEEKKVMAEAGTEMVDTNDVLRVLAGG